MYCVGTIASLEQHRQARRNRLPAVVRQGLARTTLYFDLCSPYTYLAAERAERLFARLEWLPASADILQSVQLSDEDVREASERAALLGLPLVWPEERSYGVRGAMRVASLAAERGCGGAFVLAASRLAFCGGFDLDDPEILAEAAAAAGIGLAETLAAVGDVGRDGPIEDAGRGLLAAGATCLPALRVGRMLFCGEDRLLEAAAARSAATQAAV
jgi:2-hydroxychromene-2-carboxylate isomerase